MEEDKNEITSDSIENTNDNITENNSVEEVKEEVKEETKEETIEVTEETKEEVKENSIEEVKENTSEYLFKDINDIKDEKENTIENTPKEAVQKTEKTNTAVRKTPVKPKKKDVELSLGKNFMGILASVLVFAGLILLAKAVSEVITNEIKLIIIFCISLLIYGVGMVGIKLKNNSFFMSLAGCGTGTVIICIVLGYCYFNIYGGWLYFIILTIWSVILVLLGNNKNPLFRIIGSIGLTMAIAFPVFNLSKGEIDNPNAFIPAIIVAYLIISILFICMEKYGNKAADFSLLLISLLGSFIGIRAVAFVFDKLTLAESVLYMLVIGVYIAFLCAAYIKRLLDSYKAENYAILWLVFSALGAVVYRLGLSGVFDTTEFPVAAIMGIVFVILMWIASETLPFASANKTALQVFYLVLGVIDICHLGKITELIGCGLLVIPFLVIAFISGKKRFYVFALICYVGYVIHYNKYESVYLFLGLIFTIAMWLTLMFKEELYKTGFKIALYVITNIYLVTEAVNISGNLDSFRGYEGYYAIVVSALLCIAATLLGFGKRWDKENYEIENDTVVFLRGINVVIMLIAFCNFTRCYGIYLLILDLVILVCVVMNIYPMYKNAKNESSRDKVGLYNCFKVTAYILWILHSLNVDSAIITLCSLICAIAAVIIGFAIRLKAVRLFGLIFAIISILKLVFMDLSYDSDILKAVSVLLCGAVAFGICLTYNILEKRLKNEAEEND